MLEVPRIYFNDVWELREIIVSKYLIVLSFQGTVLEVNISELGLVTSGGKVVWGKYAQVWLKFVFFCSYVTDDVFFLYIGHQ